MEPSSRLLRYPSATLTAVLLNLRPDHPEFARPGRPDRAPDGDRPRCAWSTRSSPGRGRGRDRSDPAERPRCSTRPPIRPSPTTGRPRGKALLAAGWVEQGRRLASTARRKASRSRCSAPTRSRTRSSGRPRDRSRRTGARWASRSTHVGLPAGAFVDRSTGQGRLPGRRRRRDDRAGPGPLSAARLEPDRHRRFERHRASRTRRSTSCSSAPARRARWRPGRRPIRSSRRSSAKGRYLLPLAFPDEVVVVRDTVDGPVSRQVADASDRFWDVLTWRLAEDR